MWKTCSIMRRICELYTKCIALCPPCPPPPCRDPRELSEKEISYGNSHGKFVRTWLRTTSCRRGREAHSERGIQIPFNRRPKTRGQNFHPKKNAGGKEYAPQYFDKRNDKICHQFKKLMVSWILLRQSRMYHRGMSHPFSEKGRREGFSGIAERQNWDDGCTGAKEWGGRRPIWETKCKQKDLDRNTSSPWIFDFVFAVRILLK